MNDENTTTPTTTTEETPVVAVAETNVAEETLANTVDNNAPVEAEEAPLTDAEGNVVEDETVAEEVATETETVA
jgi:hypothetical protein